MKNIFKRFFKVDNVFYYVIKKGNNKILNIILVFFKN